jgi:hypothetical protein
MPLTIQDIQTTLGTHIGFKDVGQSPSGKTRRYSVYSLEDNFLLGSIAWHSPWRKYIFSPVTTYQTIYEEVCMTEISEFIRTKTTTQREAAKARRHASGPLMPWEPAPK